MFGEINGLPVHALVIHLAVVFTPLAALLGLGLWVPRWRMRLRWPLVGAAVIAAGTIFVAKQSGQTLKTALGSQVTGANNPTAKLVKHHEDLGNRLFIAILIYLAVTVIAALLLRRLGNHLMTYGVALVVAVLAIGIIVLTVQTGEAGARARWNPDGSFDYSGRTPQ